jgi:CRP-like cAMP-binding protein
MALLINHPERAQILERLKTNIVLRTLKPKALADLEKQLVILDCKKGDILRKLHTASPYSIRAVSKARVAKIALPAWAAFLDRHAQLKSDFEYEVMHLMSEVMAHTITLHLLDAPGRVQRFLRKRPDLYERVPKKELASYLNLSAETLSRLRHRE